MSRTDWTALLVAAGSLGLALLAGFAGVLTQAPLPLIALRVWGGVVVVLAIYLGVPSQRRRVADLNLGWITAAHAVGLLPGGYFLWLYVEGTLSARFALTGGAAEAVVGLTAPIAGFWIGAGTRQRVAWLAGWHLVGLVALLHQMATGTQLHLAGENLIEIMAQFPLFLLPLYAIPLTLVGHILALFALYARR